MFSDRLAAIDNCQIGRKRGLDDIPKCLMAAAWED
jgi:hypothetical protein